MSEDNGGQRGLMTDIMIFLFLVCLALGAIYLTGNWDAFMKIMINLDKEIRAFAVTFGANIDTLMETVGSFK